MTSRYDTDPEALTWARSKVQAHIDLLAKFEQQANQRDSTDKARGLAIARISAERYFLGDGGCTIGAFDERRPEFTARINAPGAPDA
jgi:hypothetical protein